MDFNVFLFLRPLQMFSIEVCGDNIRDFAKYKLVFIPQKVANVFFRKT